MIVDATHTSVHSEISMNRQTSSDNMSSSTSNDSDGGDKSEKDVNKLTENMFKKVTEYLKGEILGKKKISKTI
ncbi:12117_t:CDS:2 [Entrophospora sp. SA101]|nr:12117_t:CDS:2 [Entrophospora sp. SA101]